MTHSHEAHEETRSDGLKIFLDGSSVLDRIRKNASKETVITAVAMNAAKKIASNYCARYAPECKVGIKEFCDHIDKALIKMDDNRSGTLLEFEF